MHSNTFTKNSTLSQSGLALFFEDKRKIQTYITESLKHIGNSAIREASAHLFSAGGKMLRSSLVTTVYKAVGGKSDDKILSVAAAMELVHNWSLVHDDIIDKSATRRGVPTVHEKWNANIAILTGDAMSNLVYLLIARSGFDERLRQEVIRCVAEANLALIDGELLDIEFETRNDVTVQNYLEMINKKTGALIQTSVRIGALLGTTNPSFVDELQTYGEKIGIAFQLKDDLLDLTGDAETGKDFAGDIKEGKKTMLLLHALKNALPAQARRLTEITSGNPATSDEIHEAIDIIRQSGAFEITHQVLNHLIDEAKQSLVILPASEYTVALTELAEFIGSRKS